MSGSLWSSDSCRQWADALERYPATVARQGSELLTRRDSWYQDELPGQIAKRRPARVMRDELVWIVEWKMARGVWRARNLHLARSNPADQVESASQAAFGAADNERRALGLLAELKGVGPATASALLAAYQPERYPFFDDIVAEQVPGLAPGEFTIRAYLAYAEALRRRSSELSSSCPQGGWTAQRVGLALWSAAGGKAG